MPTLLPQKFYYPVKPEKQVIRSVDSYTAAEKEFLLESSPNAFMQLFKYSKGKSLKEKNKDTRYCWNKFIDEKAYLQLKSSQILFYEVTAKKHRFSGFLCGVAISDFLNKHISKHEKIFEYRSKKLADYLEEVPIQAEPVLLVHEDIVEIQALESEVQHKIPFLDFKVEGTQHRLWIPNDNQQEKLIAISKEVSHFHLADGHHRSSCIEYLSVRHKKEIPVYSYVIAQNQLKIKSFFWYFKTLPKVITVDFIKNTIEVLKGEKASIHETPTTDFPILIYWRGNCFAIPKQAVDTPIAAQFIQRAFFNPKIVNDLEAVNKHFLCQPQQGKADFLTLEKQCKGSLQLAFSMQPPTAKTLFSLALKGEVLPQKSTYILPKLLTGCVVCPI